jgi:hypothetical protein
MTTDTRTPCPICKEAADFPPTYAGSLYLVWDRDFYNCFRCGAKGSMDKFIEQFPEYAPKDDA